MGERSRDSAQDMYYRECVIDSVRYVGEMVGVELRNSSVVYLPREEINSRLLEGIRGKTAKVGYANREEMMLAGRVISISLDGEIIYNRS